MRASTIAYVRFSGAPPGGYLVCDEVRFMRPADAGKGVSWTSANGCCTAFRALATVHDDSPPHPRGRRIGGFRKLGKECRTVMRVPLGDEPAIAVEAAL